MAVVRVHNPAECRQAMLEALNTIKGHYRFELGKAQEWYQVQERELEAYHRGKARGLLFAIETVEAMEGKLRLAESMPMEEDEVPKAFFPLRERRAGVA